MYFHKQEAKYSTWSFPFLGPAGMLQICACYSCRTGAGSDGRVPGDLAALSLPWSPAGLLIQEPIQPLTEGHPPLGYRGASAGSVSIPGRGQQEQVVGGCTVTPPGEVSRGSLNTSLPLCKPPQLNMQGSLSCRSPLPAGKPWASGTAPLRGSAGLPAPCPARGLLQTARGCYTSPGSGPVCSAAVSRPWRGLCRSCRSTAVQQEAAMCLQGFLRIHSALALPFPS